MANNQTHYGPGNGVVFGKTDMRRDRRRRAGDGIPIVAWAYCALWALTLLALGALIGYICAPYLLDAPAPRRDIHAAARIPEAEKRWIEQRHKYHGIYGSIEENGERYFIRDGKRCKL
jgi:hypothetical protein